MTYEELATLFSQIEAILNSRPLSPLSSDPNDPSPLTLDLFLVGRPFCTNATPHCGPIATQSSKKSVNSVGPGGKRSSWPKCSNGLSGRRSICCGDLVLLREANLPLLQWRLRRVTRLHPGPYGVSRVVDVIITKRTVTRAVRIMYPLFRDTSSS